jgi:hypothetical protein
VQDVSFSQEIEKHCVIALHKLRNCDVVSSCNRNFRTKTKIATMKYYYNTRNNSLMEAIAKGIGEK